MWQEEDNITPLTTCLEKLEHVKGEGCPAFGKRAVELCVTGHVVRSSETERLFRQWWRNYFPFLNVYLVVHI